MKIFLHIFFVITIIFFFLTLATILFRNAKLLYYRVLRLAPDP